MAYTIVITSFARKQLEKLPKDVQVRIMNAINSLIDVSRPNGCKKLKGRKNAYRIRIGNYRVVYGIEDSILIITVVAIDKRDSVYDL